MNGIIKNLPKIIFAPPPTPNRPQLAVDMARLSRMAYSTPEYIEDMWRIAQKKKQIGISEPDQQTIDVLKRVPLKPIFCNSPIGDSQSYAVNYHQPHQPPKLVLVARGTSSWKDALCDANIRLVHCDNFGKIESLIRIHSGFYQQFRALQQLFDSIVDPYMSKSNNDLICTGHSLGGAVATITALIYAIQYPQRISCYTFGSPRVGNKAFAELFDQHIPIAYRYKRNCDTVTKVPLAIMYQHAGIEHHFGEPDNHPDIPSLSGISDHDITGYTKDLLDLHQIEQLTRTNIVVKYLNLVHQSFQHQQQSV